MEQPKSFESSTHPNFVCKLIKSLHGLKQTSRAWFDKLKYALLQRGFISSKSRFFLISLKKNSSLILLLVYIDDILLTGNDVNMIAQLVLNLNKEFALKDLGVLSYFLGFEASSNDKRILLTQNKYVVVLLKRQKWKIVYLVLLI